MEAADIRSTKSDRNADIRPYRPSWIDYLVTRIERFPGQTWVFYLVAFLLTCLLNNVAMWFDGAMPFGAFDPLFTFGAVYVIYGTGFSSRYAC